MTRFARPLRPILPLTALALIAAVVIPFCNRRAPAPPQPTNPPLPSPTPAVTAAPAFPPDRAALRPVEPSAAFPRSPLADALNSPATTPADDLRAVGRMLALYRERFGAYPSFGDNAQLVNALAGANPHRIALLPRDASAVSPATGELLDRWGAPYFFHAVSRNALEIRSAGPDRELHTEDDLVSPLGFPGTPRDIAP